MIVTDEMAEAAARVLPGVAYNEVAWASKVALARSVLSAGLATAGCTDDEARREADAWKGEAELLATVLRRNPLGERDLALECFDAFRVALLRKKEGRG